MKLLKLQNEKLAVVEFSYSESCHNVYKKFSVEINGKKSNIVGLRKFLSFENEMPSIITANTYFWHPSANSGGRRYNEAKREQEALAYFLKEGFVEDAIYPVSIPGLIPLQKEAMGIDEVGYYLKVKAEKYHFGFVKVANKDLAFAREEILKRRRLTVQSYFDKRASAAKAAAKKEAFMIACKTTFVSVNDSIQAGNCEAGTMRFYNNLPLVKKGFHVRSVRADALLSYCTNSFTLRAVNQAIANN